MLKGCVQNSKKELGGLAAGLGAHIDENPLVGSAGESHDHFADVSCAGM